MPFRVSGAILLGAVLTAGAPPVPLPLAPSGTGEAARPQGRVGTSETPWTRALAEARAAAVQRLPAPEARDLDAFYAARAGQPAWLDPDRRPSEAARQAIALLGDSAADGLDPDDYDAGRLAAELAALGESAPRAADAAAPFETALTSAMLRFYRHLHLGRVDPRRLGLQIVAPEDGHDFAVSLGEALGTGRLAEKAAELSPPLAQYRLLRATLARYRALAATTRDSLVLAARTIRPGDESAELAGLQRFLALVGDLPDGPPAPGVYAEPLADAVRRFQARHGLTVDGVIGPATRAALSVPLAWRVRQLELALERLRWLPDLSQGRLIAVNIPMFRLWAWDRVPSAGTPALSMAVIVGRALGTRTPVFADRLEHVIFRPYWNVPRSILVNEILPALRRDPDYLSKENYEIVAGPMDTSPVLPPAPEHVAALARGAARLRQRPGASNALGLIKFMFPNQNDVYMHDTPAPYLFARSRRDFSHGCIRVEDPQALAAWVLDRNGGWGAEDVVAAMHGASNRRVDLADPIQVVIFYTTAVVWPEDGRVYFAEDIYRQDAGLDRAL
jgi:murein L,D-transpeptidase YcbB/YkuD